MKVLVYWHDLFLPHSAYIIKAFDQCDWIDQAVLLGPEVSSNAEAIFNQSSGTHGSYQVKKAVIAKVKTYRFMPKCCQLSEYKHYIKLYKPDLIIILDEPLSMNVLLAGLARYQVQPQHGKVLFYCFENIYSAIPIRYFLDRPDFSRLLSTCRKSIRFLLIDQLLMPFRKKLVYGGLTSYEECTAYIHKNNWYPKIKEQWWPIDLDLFTSDAPVSLNDDRVNALTSQNKNIIAFIGRFVREKGIEDLIQAISELDDSFVLLLIGSGNDQPLIEAWIDQYQVKERVLIIGPQPPQTLVKYLDAINLLVLPSRTEYFWKEQYGRILVEAMASKTLVLGSNSGAIPYVIEDHRFIFEEKDVQQLKEKLTFIFNNNMCKDENVLEKIKIQSLKADTHHFIKAFCEL